mgnify:FL=1|jgi:hypothetical protein
MENLLESLLSNFDNNSLQELGKQANLSPKQAKGAMESAIPLLMSALSKNSSTEEGATQLQNAINRDHDGSILDNLGGFLQNPQMANGAGILRHVLGNKQNNATAYVSKSSGVSTSSAAKILEIAAPMIMGFLGKKSSSNQSTGINDILGSLLSSSTKPSKKNQSIITKLLDQDGDGDIMDDISKIGTSFLGRLFKK